MPMMYDNVKTSASQNFNFSPMYINWNLLSSEEILGLYKFWCVSMPGTPSSNLANQLLELENNMHRILVKMSPEARQELQDNLEGITVDLSLEISHKSHGKIFSFPINLVPSEVIKRAILGKGIDEAYEKQMEDMKKQFQKRMEEEVKKEIKKVLEGFLKGEILKSGFEKAVKGIKDLIGKGAIAVTGELSPDITVSDLLFGKYSQDFAKITNEEVLSEVHVLQRTLASIFEWEELEKEGLAGKAREELEIIESNLKAITA